MENYLLKFLEHEFEEYPNIDRQIAIRKLELDIKEQDSNIGGGSSNLPTSPTEISVLRHLEDHYIQKQGERKEEVERALKRMNNEQKRICEMKFWSDNYYTWNELAEEFHYSSKTMYNKRYKILKILAEEKGLQ